MRWDEGDVRTGPATGARGVPQSGFNKGAAVAIEAAISSLEVRDGSDQRAVRDIITTRGEDIRTLDKRRGPKAAPIVKVDNVALSLHTNDSGQKSYESGFEHHHGTRKLGVGFEVVYRARPAKSKENKRPFKG